MYKKMEEEKEEIPSIEVTFRFKGKKGRKRNPK